MHRHLSLAAGGSSQLTNRSVGDLSPSFYGQAGGRVIRKEVISAIQQGAKTAQLAVGMGAESESGPAGGKLRISKVKEMLESSRAVEGRKAGLHRI